MAFLRKTLKSHYSNLVNKVTITLSKLVDFSGLNIVGNTWDNVSTQLNKIDDVFLFLYG